MEKIFDEFQTLFNELMEKIKASLDSHGDWSDYSEDDIYGAVFGEVGEYWKAFVFGVIDGDHGQISELLDVAVTALKGVRVLRRMGAEEQQTDENLERP